MSAHSKEIEQVTVIPLADIDSTPDLQIRSTPITKAGDRAPDVDDLVRDITENGQLVPVFVFRKKQGGTTRYVLIDGHRRVQALRQIKSNTVQAIVKGTTLDVALKFAFTMNMKRKNLKPLDISNAIYLAKKRKWSIKRIEADFGLEHSQQNRYTELLQSPVVVLNALSDSKINMSQALAITAGGADKANKLLDIAITNKLSARRIQDLVKPKGSKGRRRSPISILTLSNGVSRVRKFSFSDKDSPADFTWLENELGLILQRLKETRSASELLASWKKPEKDNRKPSYLHTLSRDEAKVIATKPGQSDDGKPFDFKVEEHLDSGDWHLECVSPKVLGLRWPLEIYRAVKKTNLILPWIRNADAKEYCPGNWADLRIGEGACGLRCRGCFLVMTHRVFCDPSRHVVFENVEDYADAVYRWLKKPDRKNLGLGIDCSDSLLYEGVTGHARRLIPLFADSKWNPDQCKIILLTKSKNVHYLEGLPTTNVVLTFSLNPQEIANLWEGKFGNGEMVTPSISERLQASLRGQEMGFDIRWRIDPVIPADNWQGIYAEFFASCAKAGHRPSIITVGSYRQMGPGLERFVEKWGLPKVEWHVSDLIKDGDHLHLPEEDRVSIYRRIVTQIHAAWAKKWWPTVALCKEPLQTRKRVCAVCDKCNCGW